MNDTQPSLEMPRYVCHKTVHALKVGAEWEDDILILYPEDPRYARIIMPEKWGIEKKVTERGYFVVYEDGYTSWSPAETFEKGYTPESEFNPDSLETIEVELKPATETLLGKPLTFKDEPYAGESPSPFVHELEEAHRVLNALLRRYVEFVDSGDGGNFDSSKEQVVIDARRVLEGAASSHYVRYSYYVPPCGCRGFFHDSACSEQNPLDPFSGISNPDNQQRVKRMAKVAAVYDSPDPLEAALIAVARATDGSGRKIILSHARLGPDLCNDLRSETRSHMHKGSHDSTVFLNDTGPSLEAEAAYWRNLALLANATAAAVDLETTPDDKSA